MERRVVIGVGNEYRRDDGFGPRVVAELAERRRHDPRLAGVDLRVSDGEPARMLEAWTGADVAVVVDVARGGPPGEWTELALPRTAEPATSGHGFGLGATVALAHELDRLPRRLVALVAYGVEFGFGTGLSDVVAAAVSPVAERVCELGAPS
ncbi:hydrogenase maturation protease [Actinoplanes campanulatus]|uniref:Hydrogenase maturation protease n=1 Tax=Actinoplanes campanulatus TaxID=113559 RepID=A0A7W5ARH3_9ACTN|nr:hydrogenase maturation protease [Actinoplanes campanulatus]MBB3101087.1 hydrogenase maturation protease [Actinoplanes campanulatus]GGN51773.1 peptidase M52 [Actinoplanes campanulatus]GID42052.1 peptidase M52 [Actinoplanes campanulatus]